MGEEEGEIPFMYLHQVSDKWVWCNDSEVLRTETEDWEGEDVTLHTTDDDESGKM